MQGFCCVPTNAMTQATTTMYPQAIFLSVNSISSFLFQEVCFNMHWNLHALDAVLHHIPMVYHTHWMFRDIMWAEEHSLAMGQSSPAFCEYQYHLNKINKVVTDRYAKQADKLSKQRQRCHSSGRLFKHFTTVFLDWNHQPLKMPSYAKKHPPSDSQLSSTVIWDSDYHFSMVQCCH